MTPDNVIPDTWHMARDMWYMTCDIWHVTHGGGWKLSKNINSLALTFWNRQCFDKSERKDHSINAFFIKVREMNIYISKHSANKQSTSRTEQAPNSPGNFGSLIWVATSWMHIVSKTSNIFFTFSKFCDFFWNVLIKTDLSLFRQLCGHVNNFQPVLDIICYLHHPGSWGPRLTFKVNQIFRADRGLPMVQTAQNHTLIQNNMLHPSKSYQIPPQLTARMPRAPQKPPRTPKKVKKCFFLLIF